MPNSDPTPFRISRRTLLKAGVAGGAALLLARWLYTPTSPPTPSAPNTLDAGARGIVAAIIPVLLDGALPSGPEAPAAHADTLTAVEEAIAGLAPATRKELADLFSLLGFPPTRCLVVGIWSPWPEATPQSIASFLTRWRDALHQLVFAAWYADPRAWVATGYAGPPSLEIG